MGVGTTFDPSADIWTGLSYGLNTTGYTPRLHVVEPVADGGEVYDLQECRMVPVETRSICAHRLENLEPATYGDEPTCAKCETVMICRTYYPVRVDG